MIDGIGGAFIFSNDAGRLAAWYRDHLGVQFEQAGEYGAFNTTFWALDPDDVYEDQPFMVNLRVRDIDVVLERLASKGVGPIKREDYDCGRFAWIRDQDGNRIELYQSLHSG